MSLGNVCDEGVGMNEMKERRRVDIEGWYSTVVTWSQLANGQMVSRSVEVRDEIMLHLLRHGYQGMVQHCCHSEPASEWTWNQPVNRQMVKWKCWGPRWNNIAFIVLIKGRYWGMVQHHCHSELASEWTWSQPVNRQMVSRSVEVQDEITFHLLCQSRADIKGWYNTVKRVYPEF